LFYPARLVLHGNTLLTVLAAMDKKYDLCWTFLPTDTVFHLIRKYLNYFFLIIPSAIGQTQGGSAMFANFTNCFDEFVNSA